MDTDATPLPPLLDLDQLENFVPLGLADYLDLLGDVIQDVPGHLEMIHSAIRDNDVPALNARAHSMRGMLANFGCIGMTGFLHRLEYDGPVPPEFADTVHTELEILWQQSLAAIKEWETSVPEFS